MTQTCVERQTCHCETKGRRTAATVLIMNGRESLITGVIAMVAFYLDGFDTLEKRRKGERRVERTALLGNRLARKSEERSRELESRGPNVGKMHRLTALRCGHLYGAPWIQESPGSAEWIQTNETGQSSPLPSYQKIVHNFTFFIIAITYYPIF
jgi:hypothetical protein